MRTFSIISAFLFLPLLSGCAHRFSGGFVFTNSSTKRLWVQASGFERSPPVGILAPGVSAGSGMNPQRLPEVATISWSEDGVVGMARTNISLAQLPFLPGRGRITFEFTPAGVWILKYDTKD